MMRTGLFLTRHQGVISDVVDVDGLAVAYAEVAVAKVYDRFLETNDLRDMLSQVKAHRLNAVVVAGYSAHLMETSKAGKSILNALKVYGVNPNRVAFANICEQVALTHAGQPRNATEKARLLIASALAKVAHCPEVNTLAIRPNRAVMVIGTTAAGLIAARELLSKNLNVILMDKAAAWRLANPQDETLAAMCDQVRSDPNARILFESNLADMSGWAGDYKVVLETPYGNRPLGAGAILLCPGNDTQWIAQLQPKMRLALDREGYLLNAAGNRSSGQTRDAGIWFATPSGAGNGIKAEAEGVRLAVSAIAELLDKPRIEHPLLVSEVNATLCGGCGTCVKTCAFSASGIDAAKKISVIDAQRCRGCGNCVTACPTSARDLLSFPTLYVHRAIEILSQGAPIQGEPKILAFLCKNSGYRAADIFGRHFQKNGGSSYSPSVLPLPMECGGHIDTVYLLKAFKEGFDGVALVVCKDHHCHNLVGNTDMERRVGLLRAVLRSRRMDDNRMRIIHVFGHEGQYLNEELRAFSAELKRLNRI
jgi:heterodisulfide reductase subunit A-like polyferredoxin/coenzyme F420-reducing hydrogenase delta subunit